MALRTPEEIELMMEKTRRRVARYRKRQREYYKQYKQFPLKEDDFIAAISERVIEDGQPVRMVRLVLLLKWARENGIIR